MPVSKFEGWFEPMRRIVRKQSRQAQASRMNFDIVHLPPIFSQPRNPKMHSVNYPRGPMPNLRVASLRRWGQWILCLLVFSTSCVIAGELPAGLRDHAELIPERVQQRFHHPDEGFHSLLLIRTAINEGAPVFRIIAIRKDNADVVQSVRLFQFDQHGNDHAEFSGEKQAVIEFQSDDVFEARVKGKRTTVSFAGQSFEFVMHGIFGLRIKQPVDAEGKITVEGKPAGVLLIRTSDKDEWQWVCDDGTRLAFQR